MNPATAEIDTASELDNLDQLLLQSRALQMVGCGVMITDRQARILWVNPAFSRTTGYPAEEVLGQTPRILKSGKHPQAFYGQFWKTVLGGETWRGQFLNRRRDGSLCLQAQTTIPLRWDSTGPITHFISVLEDIADTKQEEGVCLEARNLAVVGQLASGIAHQFNNLLTVIHCNTQLLLELNDGCDPDIRNLEERILAASGRAAYLVRQLVAFSQSRGLVFQALDLNQVVEGVVRGFNSTTTDRIGWERCYQASLPAVLADGGMLGQAISQVLVNAIDAMSEGGHLSLSTELSVLTPSQVRCHPAAGSGEFVCLTIRDTGCGISSTNLLRIFEPFFTTKDTAERSGLGLALVYGIVTQHGGWVEASSQEQQGATFRIFLPAVTHGRAVALP